MNQFAKFLAEDMKFTFPSVIAERIAIFLFETPEGQKYLEGKGYIKKEEVVITKQDIEEGKKQLMEELSHDELWGE